MLVPEGRQIFVSLTVHENLLMGAYCRTDDVAAEAEAIYERDSRTLPNVGTCLPPFLSGGEQQMLAIGRAMLAKPKLMMLDEPSLGLSPILVSQLFELIRDLNRRWSDDDSRRAEYEHRLWQRRPGAMCSNLGRSCFRVHRQTWSTTAGWKRPILAGDIAITFKINLNRQGKSGA